MDILWAVTIAANTTLLLLLLRRKEYLDLPFLTFLVGFNVITAPIMWVLYDRFPDMYAIVYDPKVYCMFVLWFAVTLEAYYMGEGKIATPVELYALIKVFAAVFSHAGLVQAAYWINNSMRIFNLAVILWWISIFAREERTYE